MNKALTLIELLLTLGLIVAVVALTAPIGVKFYVSQALDDTANNILETLRRAHNQAVFQKNDSAFGVKILTDSYVLFEGSSYAARNQSKDEIFDLAEGISLSGADEVVFSKLYGTSIGGTVMINSAGQIKSININAQGKVEHQ